MSPSGDRAPSHAVHLVRLWGRHSECSVKLHPLLYIIVVAVVVVDDVEMDILADCTYLTRLHSSGFLSGDQRINGSFNSVT